MGSRNSPSGDGCGDGNDLCCRLVRSIRFVRQSPKKAAQVASALAWRRLVRRAQFMRWACHLLTAGRPLMPVDGGRVFVPAGNGSGRDERGGDAKLRGNCSQGVVGDAPRTEGPKFGRYDRGSATGISVIVTVVILSWVVGCTLAEGLAKKEERPNPVPEMWARPKPKQHDNEQSQRVALTQGRLVDGIWTDW